MPARAANSSFRSRWLVVSETSTTSAIDPAPGGTRPRPHGDLGPRWRTSPKSSSRGAGRPDRRRSILDDIVIGDLAVRGQVDHEAAIGLVRHQAIVEDTTHLALVPFDLARGNVPFGEEGDGLQIGEVRRGTVPEILACAGGDPG